MYYHNYHEIVAFSTGFSHSIISQVDILIKKEEEIGLDNYKRVEVPDEVIPQLHEMDKEYLKD